VIHQSGGKNHLPIKKSGGEVKTFFSPLSLLASQFVGMFKGWELSRSRRTFRIREECRLANRWLGVLMPAAGAKKKI
jgi:hypothetical protein